MPLRERGREQQPPDWLHWGQYLRPLNSGRARGGQADRRTPRRRRSGHRSGEPSFYCRPNGFIDLRKHSPNEPASDTAGRATDQADRSPCRPASDQKRAAANQLALEALALRRAASQQRQQLRLGCMGCRRRQVNPLARLLPSSSSRSSWSALLAIPRAAISQSVCSTRRKRLKPAQASQANARDQERKVRVTRSQFAEFSADDAFIQSN